MVPEIDETRDSAGRRYAPALFYQKRRRVSMGLLLFVVLAGLPIVGVPQLRGRLSERISALKFAMSGEIPPATLNVGMQNNPFPTEYDRPEPIVPKPPELPPMERIFTMQPAPPVSRPRPARETVRIETPSPGDDALDPAIQAGDASSPGTPEPKYQQGQTEQEAYKILLDANPAVAAMVQGSNPSAKFKSWDALSRGDDIYWVRLKFRSEEGTDDEYIWQVKLQSREITPLSHNARSLP